MDATETAIKQSATVNPEELEEKGWKNTGQFFAHYQIWANKEEKKALLLIPEKNFIYMLYSTNR
jgi:hypothetical protein